MLEFVEFVSKKRNGGSAMSGTCRTMSDAKIALPGWNHRYTCPILTKLVQTIFMQFSKILSFFKIVKFGGSYKDKQHEKIIFEKDLRHNLENLTCKISNFQL